MSTKTFPTPAVLSIVTDVLVCEIGGVYEVLNWMTGESLFTHQLPRVGREATPVILTMHPHLQEAVAEAEQVNPDNYREWLTRWKDRYGDEIAVPKLTIDDHERIDPLSEIAELLPPERIIVIGG